MRDKCFRCLEKGHFKTDCTNDIVCILCSLPGHVAKDCKRARSPSSADERRREAVAKVARRSSPRASLERPAPSGAAHRVTPPPPPPSPATPAL